MDNDSDNELSLLLADAADSAEVQPTLREDDSFAKSMSERQPDDDGASSSNVAIPKKESSSLTENNKASSSNVAADQIDSSDDEDVSNFLARKYNEYGRDIKSVLRKQADDKIDRLVTNEVSRSINNAAPSSSSSAPSNRPHVFPVYNGPRAEEVTKPKPMIPIDANASNVGVYTDPIFGIRIVHPLISSTMLQERMTGRKPVSVSDLRTYLAHNDVTQDWAFAGVIVSKGTVMTSKKGAQFQIWKISDLKTDLKMISLFLFKDACKKLWKTAPGMVVAVLNPSTFDGKQRDALDDVTLCVDTAQKFMILGQSKDLGVCKSRKKNGDQCTAVVNKHTCEYCVYHVQQEYGKMSGRSELQSSSAGRGLQGLRNKVLGKSEVFYGGQSYSAVPAKKNPKLVAKDNHRLMTLSEYYQSPNSGAGGSTTTARPAYANGAKKPVTKTAPTLDANVQQRQKDLERLRLLNDHRSSSTSEELPSPAASQTTSSPPSALEPTEPSVDLSRFQNRQFSVRAPTLKRDGFSLDIAAASSSGTSVAQLSKSQFAKTKATEILKRKPIEKSNPNFVRHRGTEAGKKRALEVLQQNDETAAKKQKITDAAEQFQRERIQAMINAKSSHTELIDAHHSAEQDKYFDRLEKKEAMEDKMLNTFQMDCKAVVCQTCKYTAFSAADRCKEERHPLRVIDAKKRFFECQDCGGRTATVHRMPQMSCKNCQSSRWKRAAMIKDRKSVRVADQLSIRGDEETFLGSNQTGNLNLCVASED